MAYFNRGQVFEGMSQKQRAIEDYDEAIRLAPTYAIAYFTRSRAHMFLGQHQQALEDLDEAIRLDPDFGRDYHNRGKISVRASRN